MPGSVKAFLVEIGADTRDFLRGTQQADRALEELATGSEADLDRMARSAKDAADDIERAFEGAARDSRAAFRKVGQDAGDEMRQSGVKETFGEAGGEVGAEFASNLGESLASGDVTSIAKDTAGGLVSAFAGIAGPIGIGLAGVATVATSVFAKMQAEAEARTARIAAITGAIFDELSQSVTDSISEMTRGQAYQEFVKGFSKNGDLGEGMREMQTLAKRAGVGVGEIAAAFVNGGPAAEALKKRLATIRADGTTIAVTSRTTTKNISDSAKAAGDLAGRIGEADQATKDAEASTHALWEAWVGTTAQIRLAESAASRTSSSLSKAAAAAARVRGPAGTVVGGRALGG